MLRASTGATLADAELCTAYRELLLPRATVITPNQAEAVALLEEHKEHRPPDIPSQSRALRALGWPSPVETPRCCSALTASRWTGWKRRRTAPNGSKRSWRFNRAWTRSNCVAIDVGVKALHLDQEDLHALSAQDRFDMQAARAAVVQLGISSNSLWELCRAANMAPGLIA